MVSYHPDPPQLLRARLRLALHSCGGEDLNRLVHHERGRYLRVREVHAAVEELYGERVPFSSVNEVLSTHASGDRGRFRRVRYGTYESA